MVQVDEQRAISRVMDLIAIPGGSGGEQDVSAWICQQLLNAGVPESSIATDSAHRKSPAGGNTGNLIIRLPGTKKGPRPAADGSYGHGAFGGGSEAGS